MLRMMTTFADCDEWLSDETVNVFYDVNNLIMTECLFVFFLIAMQGYIYMTGVCVSFAYFYGCIHVGVCCK